MKAQRSLFGLAAVACAAALGLTTVGEAQGPVVLRNSSGAEIATSGTPLRVDPTGSTTQPVSAASLPLPSGAATGAKQDTGNTSLASIDGKITAVNTGAVVVSSSALPTGASTAAKQPALGTAGTASTDVLTIQGIAGMTKLLVTPDSVALPANQSVNVNQLAGTTTDTNSGTKSAGTLRVVIATDQPALTNKLLVTPDSVALPANQSVNVSQINGVTTLMGNGVTGTGSQRVTIASDNTAFTVNAAESGTWTVQPGNTANTTAWIVQPVAGTTNGASTCVLQSAASTNSTNCKASAGLLYGIEVINTTSTLYYLRLYNASSAPTCSSATGFIRTVPIPHNTGSGAGLANFYTVGETYGTGIGFCLTGGGSSTDNTNAATGVYLTLHYK